MFPEIDPARFTHAIMVTGSRTWGDAEAVRTVFNRLRAAWPLTDAFRPVLFSGHCPDGADAIAERVWAGAGFEILTFPAEWGRFGRSAGPRRNQDMVDALVAFRAAGVRVVCVAFLEQCSKATCPQSGIEQLSAEGTPGHWSHGTVHARGAAIRAGIETVTTHSA
ncbi:MAG: SLOG family protein [Microbacterium sp.]